MEVETGFRPSVRSAVASPRASLSLLSASVQFPSLYPLPSLRDFSLSDKTFWCFFHQKMAAQDSEPVLNKLSDHFADILGEKYANLYRKHIGERFVVETSIQTL